MKESVQNLRNVNFQPRKHSLKNSKSQDSILLNHPTHQNNWGKKKESSQVLSIVNQTFYVLVPVNKLQDQVQIYEWRRNTPPNVVPILDFTIISRGSIFNPNALIKLTLDNSFQSLHFIHENFTLTRTIFLIKQILNGLKNITQIFSPYVITDNMITIGEGGNVRIWMMDSLQRNPQNDMNCLNQYTKCSQKNCLISMLKIMETRCLKTKMSFQFFTILSKIYTIQATISEIQTFQQNNKFFCPIKLINSLSTNPQSSLQFSQRSIKRKKKSKKNNLEDRDLHFSLRNIKSSFEQPVKNKERQRSLETKDFIRLSLDNNWRYTQQQASSLLTPQFLTKKNSEAGLSNTKSGTSEHASFIFSQTFKEDESAVIKNIPKLPNPASKISWFSSKSNISLQHKMQMIQLEIPAKIPELQASHEISIKIDGNIMQKKEQQMFESQTIQQNQQIDLFHIINRNGWNLQVKRLSDSPVKQSFMEGKDVVRQKTHQRKLSKLQKLGKQMVQSICHDSD